MNTAELMQAVEDAGCEFDCNIAYAGCDKKGDALYDYLREIDEVWVMLPEAFTWVHQKDAPNNPRLFASFDHIHDSKYDVWRIGSIYSKVDVVYDYPNEEDIHERVPVAIELNEGANPYEEREHLTNPGALTMLLRDLVDEARTMTKEIKAAQVRIAAKRYEV